MVKYLVLLMVFVAFQAQGASKTCQGVLVKSRRVVLEDKAGKLSAKIYDKQNLLLEGALTKKLSKDPGEERLILTSGKILRGGFQIRLVTANEKFPSKVGKGHVTFRSKGKMVNDIIQCPAP